MRAVFVQFRCEPGKTYQVAEAIYDREVVSELFSTSGDYDLIAKVYIPEDEDVGRFHGNVGAGRAHGKADIGLRQCGCVVDAVARHGSAAVIFLQVLNGGQFIFGQ